MGLEVLLVNLLSTHLDNSVGIDYYMKRSYLQNDSRDEERAYRLEEQNSELQLELARCIQSLYETLGLIIVVFHIATNHQMIKDINKMLCKITEANDDSKFKIPEDIEATEDLIKWNETIKTKIRDEIVPKIALPIDNLLKYLENELKSEKQPCELRCCFCRTP